MIDYTNSISDYENLAARGIISEADKLSSIEAVLQSAGEGRSTAMLCAMCIIPVILLVLSSFVYLKKYRLDEKAYDRICRSLEERNR